MILEINKKKLEIVEAKSFSKRLKGLMGVSPITYGMYFKNCNGIHTYFMKENIDVIGLNEQNEVIYIYRNLPKNQIIKLESSAKKTSILELPKDTSKHIKMGSILFFKDEDVI